jgi:hypothetical protein
MTTTVQVHVNGKYRAHVTVSNKTDETGSQTVIVEGNYEGSPNPSGNQNFYLAHPAEATFRISEEPVE